MDAIPLPENDTSGNASIMLSFRNFGIQIQQLPHENISFTPDLTSLIENIRSTNKMVSNNEDIISTVTLPPELSSTSPSVVLAVFLRTGLFPPNNSNSSVGSVVISVSTPNQTVQNLAEPVIFTFGKNEVRASQIIVIPKHSWVWNVLVYYLFYSGAVNSIKSQEYTLYVQELSVKLIRNVTVI